MLSNLKDTSGIQSNLAVFVNMISIDGSLGEGGGQILRTAIAMSALRNMPVKIKNIRANRPNPGLSAQHAACLKAVGMLCNAEIDGLKIGSKEISFTPGEIKAKKLVLDVGTAGSVTLVLQALLPPALHSEEDIEISIRGGTDVEWSPPIDYLRFVLAPILRSFGYSFEIKLVRRGYYPIGGGLVEILVKPLRPRKIMLLERGAVKKIVGISHASKLLEKRDVAGRCGKSARVFLLNKLSSDKIDSDINIDFEYCDTPSTGSGLTLWAECENTIVGASALGSKLKKAEDVGDIAAGNLVSELRSRAPVDSHMADQLIPYLGLLGGVIKVPNLSSHAETNIIVVNQFGFKVEADGDTLKS